MNNQGEINKLAEWFSAFGARDPESWAKSQVEEGINQWGRFVFLHQAWKNIIPDRDTTWITPLIEEADKKPNDPGAAAGPALRRMLQAGVNPQDITDVVRVMQWHILFDLMYQLSDPSIVEYPSKNMKHVQWMLFEVDDDENPIDRIDMLHESVLDTDPTGREMTPRKVDSDN
jgi:hypothetical protein